MRAQSFLHANLARALGYRNQHDVHQSDSADAQRQHADEAEQNLDSDCNDGEVGQIFVRVKHKNRALIFRIEAVVKRHGTAYSSHYFLVISLVVQEDAIKVISIFDVAHCAVRKVNQRIHVFVTVRNRVLEHTDDFVRDSVDADAFSQRVLTGEQLFFHGRANDGYAAVSEVLLLSKECSVANFQVADPLVAGIDSVNSVAPAARAVRDLTLFVHLGRDSSEHWNLSPQIVEIVARQANLCTRLAAPGLQRSATGENADQVASEGAEGNHQGVLKS